MLHEQENKKLLEQVKLYVYDTLSIPRPEFAGSSICPYAGRFRESIRIKTAQNTPYEVLSWAIRNWSSMDVCWVYAWSSSEMPNAPIAEKIHLGFEPMFRNTGATLILDHPGIKEPVAGVNTGFTNGMLFTIINTDIHQRMRRQLMQTDYYSNWTDENKRNLCE